MCVHRDCYRVAVGASVALVAAGLTTASASAADVWLSHDMSFTFQQADFSGGIRPHPNVVQFFGNALVTLQPAAAADGGVVDNPLYKDKGVKGNNPLCGDTTHFRSQDIQLEVADFISLAFEADAPVVSMRSGGIVHRDLATRNILLSTRFGDYMSASGGSLVFSSDAPLDAYAGDGKPPIRWTAPEVLRLYRNGDVGSGDWIDIDAGASFQTLVIPAPAAMPLLLGGVALAARRRR